MTDLDNNVPLPLDEPNDVPVPTAKKPRSRARKQASNVGKAPNPMASLLAALKFVAVAQKKAGPVGLQFAHITGGWLAASDEILTVATPITEDLEVCPQTLQFIEALSKVENDVALTQVTPQCLAVTSGQFRILVPCVAPDEVPINGPDPQCAVASDRVKWALGAVQGLPIEGSPEPHLASVLLQANTAVGTNGAALLEAWHGVDLPPNLMIPKASAKVIANCSKAMTGFGYSQSSATFYFEDGSFIKTQLYAGNYANYQIVFGKQSYNPMPIPADFFKAVKLIESFSPEGYVFFQDGCVFSTERREEASLYKLEGLPSGIAFQAKFLTAVEHGFKDADFDIEAKKVVFFGESIRGALMGIGKAEPKESDVEYVHKGAGITDDDIPF